MYTFTSVNDELNELKVAAQKAGLIVQRFEKIGNGNMSAFKMIYKEQGDDATIKEAFFWRHDMESFLEKLNARAQRLP